MTLSRNLETLVDATEAWQLKLLAKIPPNLVLSREQ
jgi:hypothetical protein